ncbi:hypothetical protein LCGC14_0991140 [marine sediment metagenome]|uniref:Uncharacterized protein n=1 Tax=marine sediment metagenome TaxID=412755 RepID=A0A0F9NSB6_9ZZZZ
MNDSVFTTSFIDRIKTTLDENCTEGTGQCITRTNLAKALGLDLKLRLESALGTLVTSGKIAGYEVRKGPRGGIGRTGERVERKPSTPSTPDISDEFKGKLMAALQTLCDSDGTPVPRDQIQEHMGVEKSLPLISAAVRLDEFSDFKTKVGKGGGVRRIVETLDTEDEIECNETEPGSENLGQDLTASMEENTEDEDEELAEAAI